MGSLDVLEPRVAGEEILEPEREFTVQWQGPRLHAGGREGDINTYSCVCIAQTHLHPTTLC
jgi:hypothetical protein